MSHRTSTAPILPDTELQQVHLQAAFTDVARRPFSPLPRHVGRGLAGRLGYDHEALHQVPAAAVDSFSGVGNPHPLARLQEDERVLDLGCGAGLDSFLAALAVGPGGQVDGVDVTPAQLHKARTVRDRAGYFPQVSFLGAAAEGLPMASYNYDCVIANGLMSLTVAKQETLAEAARVLKPGGRLILSDLVTAVPMPERAACDGYLWASGLGGAMHRRDYQQAIADAGFELQLVQINHYHLRAEALQLLASEHGARSITVRAIKR